jgi:hemerythrin-like domain-containing protein
MKTDQTTPADTRMMGIVHTALRRDLDRATGVLSQEIPPSDQQRDALGAHMEWMMRFLHDHHAGEDDGLYPMVRDRNQAAADLLDAMATDHELIAPCIRSVQQCAAEYRLSAATPTREALVVATLELERVLLPHLRREEDDVMPIVSRSITNGEWIAWDRLHNLEPKSFVELGREGHWLLDGLAPSDRAVVVGLVPPVPRFVLLHGFAQSYRRHRTRCWGDSSGARRAVHKSGRAGVLVDVDVHCRGVDHGCVRGRSRRPFPRKKPNGAHPVGSSMRSRLSGADGTRLAHGPEPLVSR